VDADVNDEASDSGTQRDLWLGGGVNRPERRDLVPAWLRSAEERKAAASWYATNLLHVGAYHLLRLPAYTLRLGSHAPQGVWRVAIATLKWVTDAESRELRTAAIEERDVVEYLRMRNMHRDVVKSRSLVLCALVVVFAATSGLVASPSTSDWVQTTCALGLVMLLGLIGHHKDKPIVVRALVTPRARRLTADIVIRAFTAAGLCKANDPIAFPQPIQRDGHGWRAIVDLPWGATAEQAIKRRDRLASGLDLDEVQVWPARVRGTAGSARRVAMWVADEDPYAKPSGRWPWVEGESPGSLFAPFPFGQDQRGRLVEMRLMFTSVLVGAIPRMGKTLAARLLLLAAALDPYAELHVYDGKGGTDWRSFLAVAHRCGFGARTEVVQDLRDDLRELQSDMNNRYDRMAELPADVCPEAKVTPRLASTSAVGLHPVVIGVDECQRYFEDPTYGDEIVSLLTELAKVGPAVGIIVVLATQKPDAGSVPTRLRDVIGTRFALKTMTYQSSEAVLGAGSYGAGYDASRFQRAHKGVGWLLGADDSGETEEGVTVRTFQACAADVDHVLDRARAARIAHGTLSGVAAGEEPEGHEVDVLSDVLGVFAPDEDKLWSERIIERLAVLRPGFYSGWSSAQLSSVLKPRGVSTQQVWATTEDGVQANRRGLTREALQSAQGRRT
jgi:S-DNA-T family DNA segregation ATPase FtsK/SpoIIIE